MNEYKGHGTNTGGLQSHSVGELYPLTVYGQETAEGTRYGVLDLATGEETGAQWDVHGATLIARCIVSPVRFGQPVTREERTADITRLASRVAR